MKIRAVTFNITQKRINRGERESAWRCPISMEARALGIRNPFTDAYGLSFCEQGRINIPQIASRFVIAFKKSARKRL